MDWNNGHNYGHKLVTMKIASPTYDVCRLLTRSRTGCRTPIGWPFSIRRASGSVRCGEGPFSMRSRSPSSTDSCRGGLLTDVTGNTDNEAHPSWTQFRRGWLIGQE
jgi:hypothetical protein